jgi:hypothetical protein
MSFIKEKSVFLFLPAADLLSIIISQKSICYFSRAYTNVTMDPYNNEFLLPEIFHYLRPSETGTVLAAGGPKTAVQL